MGPQAVQSWTGTQFGRGAGLSRSVDHSGAVIGGVDPLALVAAGTGEMNMRAATVMTALPLGLMAAHRTPSATEATLSAATCDSLPSLAAPGDGTTRGSPRCRSSPESHKQTTADRPRLDIGARGLVAGPQSGVLSGGSVGGSEMEAAAQKSSLDPFHPAWMPDPTRH